MLQLPVECHLDNRCCNGQAVQPGLDKAENREHEQEMAFEPALAASKEHLETAESTAMGPQCWVT